MEEVEKLHKVRCKDYESYTKKKTLYCDFCGLQNYCKKGILDFSGWEFEILKEPTKGD